MTTLLQPLTAATVPLHFVADYCLRCGSAFVDGQYCHIVKGGPAAKYHAIGLTIDEACLQEVAFDVPVALTVYRCRATPAPAAPYWPRYVGHRSLLQRFAKVMMLDNGLAFVGLHRGHVEPWTRREVRGIGAVYGSVSEDYSMASGPGVFYHQVIDVRFYNLATPLPTVQAPPPVQERPLCANAYIRGKRVHPPRPTPRPSPGAPR